jgi:hypothetical protein
VFAFEFLLGSHFLLIPRRGRGPGMLEVVCSDRGVHVIVEVPSALTDRGEQIGHLERNLQGGRPQRSHQLVAQTRLAEGVEPGVARVGLRVAPRESITGDRGLCVRVVGRRPAGAKGIAVGSFALFLGGGIAVPPHARRRERDRVRVPRGGECYRGLGAVVLEVEVLLVREERG